MPDSLISLVTVAVVTTITPGPSTLLVAAAGAQFGLRRSLPMIAGVALALTTVMAAAVCGLAALLQAAPGLYAGMKVMGSAYLLWLAWKVANSGPPPTDVPRSAVRMGIGTGLVVLWLNPKAWFAALGAAAAYAGLADGPVRLALLLGGVFGVAAASALTLWCVGGQTIGRVLRTPGQWRVVNGSLGMLTAVSIVPLWL